MSVTSTIFRSRKSTTVRTIHAPSLYDELGLKRLGPLPWINLYGSWLTGLGFERGKRLKSLHRYPANSAKHPWKHL